MGARDQHLERCDDAPSDGTRLFRGESGDQRDDRFDDEAVAAEGVTVNAVSPGTIRSAKLEDGFRTAAAERGIGPKDAPWDGIQRGVLPLFAAVPLGRVGELNELADAVAFLASPLAGYITGINLHIDGGFTSIP